MPEQRPEIPAEVQREVLTQAGHRCAVCGESCPLERAHIIPWRKSKSHSADNLICLCANCHQRADNEHWGVKTLRIYKERPWILRKEPHANRARTRQIVTVRMDVPFESFDETQQRLFIYSLSGFLGEPPDNIQILQIERGSTIVTIELSAKGASMIARSVRDQDPALCAILKGPQPRREPGLRKRVLCTDESRTITHVHGRLATPTTLVEEIFDIHYERLVRLALLRGATVQEANDIVQSAFVEFLSHKSLDSAKSLYKTVELKLADVCRERRRATRSTSRYAKRERQQVTDRTAAFGELALNVVRQALLSLPPDQREVLTLKYYLNTSIREMSLLLGLSPRVVRAQLRRALAALRRRLAAAGVRLRP